MPISCRKLFTEETEEELLKMSRDDVTIDLNDKQRRFCEIYTKNMNIRLAAINSGYGEKSAHMVGWKLRQNVDCNRYIAWLKVRIAKSCHVDAIDVIDHYIRIAFADITDFAIIEKGRARIVDGARMDGQLVSKIKSGPNGVTVELVDKMKALEKLEQYFDVMPKDWRQSIEERKLEIMKERLEIERLKVTGGSEDAQGDDGFIDALRESAIEVWGEDVGE
jgi:phage terminase small subunit